MTRFYTFLLLQSVLIYSSSALFAQDPFFSQFYANRVYLNPAYAGLDAGTQLTLNYRDQWFGVPDGAGTPFQGGFRTMNATVNQRIACFGNLPRANVGVAGSFFSDATGNAPFKTTGFALAGAFEYAIKPAAIKKSSRGLTQLDGRIGFQLSRMQSSLESNNLIYSYQLDPVVGLGPNGAPLGASLNTGAYSTLNIGGMVRGEIKHGLNNFTVFTLGASVSNVNQPEVTLFDGLPGDTISRRFTVHGGTAIKLASKKGTRNYSPVYVAPQFRWDSQYGGQLNLFTLGSYFLGRGYYTGLFYQFNTPNNGAANGGQNIGGRNTNAVILSWGVDLATLMDVGERWRDRNSGWIFGFTYDLPTSGVNASATTGTVELSCRILIHELRKTKCTVLGKRELYKGATCPVSF